MERNGSGEAYAGETEKKRRSRTPTPKRLKKLALDSILEMVNDRDLKPADRLNAVKALLDYVQKQTDAGDDGTVRIVFEDLPEGYAD